MHPSGADLAYLVSLIQAKQLKGVIDRVFPFAKAKGAIARPFNSCRVLAVREQ